MTQRSNEDFYNNEPVKNNHIFSKNMTRHLTLVIFLMLPFLLGSCEAVATIFKAGMGVGFFLVAAVIIAFVILFMRMNKNRNS